MEEVKYQLYPTLLNAFGTYLAAPFPENKITLLNRINRVNDFDAETRKKFAKGSSFEDAVLKNKAHAFDQKMVDEVKLLLPEVKVTQLKVSFIHKNIRFYGFADVVGEGRVIDIKTTSKYRPQKFAFNFQTLYLYGLAQKGCKQMEYIIYDFNEVHQEVYTLDNFDFGLMLHQMELFTEFLEENRAEITDKKIFIEPTLGGLFG
jgi:CRISPR/Cas system-associated exonuclease Cas4 (RecB family)